MSKKSKKNRKDRQIASAWWSPDQSSIAFAEFDLSKVPKKIVPNFVDRKNGEKEVFYPKIGDELPKTVLKVANLKTFTSSDNVLVLEPTSTSVKYLMSLLWLSEEEFIALWSDSSRRLNIYERCFVTQGQGSKYFTLLLTKVK